MIAIFFAMLTAWAAPVTEAEVISSALSLSPEMAAASAAVEAAEELAVERAALGPAGEGEPGAAVAWGGVDGFGGGVLHATLTAKNSCVGGKNVHVTRKAPAPPRGGVYALEAQPNHRNQSE